MSVLRRIPRKASYGLTLLMLTNLVVAVGGQEAVAHEPPFEPRELHRDEPVAVTPVAQGRQEFIDPSADQVWNAQNAATLLPQPDRRVLTLGGVGPAEQAELDGFPVAVAPSSNRPGQVPVLGLSGSVSVEILDQEQTQAAGVQGLLLGITTSGAGAADVAVDYSSFADLFGGDWSSRLRLVELPACALTTPSAAGCLELTPLGSYNSTFGQTVSARMQFGAPGLDRDSGTNTRVLALTALASSEDGGDYRATDLSPAGSWTAGGSDGAFTYSYPLRVPPAAGPVPSVSLGYSSASHDGRTSGRNSQASWLGDGWGYEPGFIERSYKPCSSDEDGSNNPQITGDLCWDGDNPHLTVSLNGTNSSLVLDDSSGQWHAAADSNWRIQQLGSPASSSSATSERWVVTTPDGTRYYFAAEATTSNSRLTVPVFGNHPGEPCRASAFADSSCDQAYRWLLDKVVDVHGNMVRYFYTTDTGHYGAAADANNRVSYDRAARLLRIEYGLRADDSSVPATGRVLFTSEHRCLGDCGSLSNPTVENWPDTPWDLHCDQAPCTGNLSPTFFSTARLAKVATQVRNGGAWRQVDSWSLEHEFKDYGDDEQVVLWLKSIQHTGHIGDDITLPKVQFAGEALPNRVDAAAGVPVMWRWRMSSIKTETGAVITVTYADPQCGPNNLPSQAHSNAMRCYPVRWTPEFHTQPLQDWFHKHVVASVVETDTTGGSVAVETYYEYSTAGGGTSMLWAFDDSEFTEDEHRTYGVWRGYPQVTTRVGDPAEQQAVTRTRFYRGMHNQPLPSGGIRSVQLTDAEGNTVTDHEALTGRVWETLTYDGTTIIAGSTYKYWTRNTATRVRDHDGGDLKAWMIGLSTEQSRTRLTSSHWQRTETRTSYDNQGRTVRVNDLGDIADTDDDFCTRIDYAESNTAWIKDTEVISARSGG